MLVVLKNEEWDRGSGVDGISMQVEDLLALAQFVQEADFALHSCSIAKGLADLDLVAVPAASVDVCESAGDVGIIDDMVDLIEGDHGNRLMEDPQDLPVHRSNWYSHC